MDASFSDSIVSMVAAVIGMIPEGLYLLAIVTLLVSVMSLASKKVLVHDMKCIETLACVNVLCVELLGKGLYKIRYRNVKNDTILVAERYEREKNN